MAKNPLSIVALMAVSSFVAACDGEVTVVEHTGKAGVVDTMDDDGEGGSGPATGSTTTASVSSSSTGVPATTTSSSSSGSGGGGGEMPMSGVTVALAADTPMSQIVLPAQGVGDLHLFTTYELSNLDDVDHVVSKVVVDQVNANGDIADFGHINVSGDPLPGLSAFAPGWVIDAFTINNSAHFESGPIDFGFNNPNATLTVPAHGTLKLHVTGAMSMVHSSASVNGAWHGVARSGHTPALGIVSLETDAGPATIADQTPSVIVLTKSHPVLTKQPLSTNVLANVDQDIMKWGEGSTSSHSWGQKRFLFTKTPGLVMSNFRLRRGVTDLDFSQYMILTSDGSFPTNGTLPANVMGGSIDIVLKQEEWISGSGQVYTIHATISGATSGSDFEIWLAPDNTIASGYIQSVTFGILTVSAMNGTVSSNSVWSDLSEVPHGFTIAAMGGSMDFLTGAYVPGTETIHEHLSL